MRREIGNYFCSSGEDATCTSHPPVIGRTRAADAGADLIAAMFAGSPRWPWTFPSIAHPDSSTQFDQGVCETRRPDEPLHPRRALKFRGGRRRLYAILRELARLLWRTANNWRP